MTKNLLCILGVLLFISFPNEVASTHETNGTSSVNCGSGLICYNGGSCNGTSSCFCPDGFYGFNCFRGSCEGLCQNGGTCSDGFCYCPTGYTGQYCTIRVEVCGPMPNTTICYNNGTCVDESCVCTSGYTGRSCLDFLCDPPCENDAYCSFGNSCQCYRGFTGHRCEIPPGPVCGSSYCYNNGNCDNETSSCNCVGGYLPPYCQCNMHCANNGTCYEGYCSCPYGYNGQYCQTRVSQCNGTTCYNNGTCDGGSCSCPYPYTGHDCTAYECDTVCYNGGTCVGSTCQCGDMYTGPSCETSTYCITQCNPGAGECINGSCVCQHPYTGSGCYQTMCDPPCQNGGYCYDGLCSCSYGFTGSVCEIAPGPECGGHYCWNDGICNGDDQCVCTSSYTGRYCQDEICPFECLNNGSCYNQQCSCPYGFNGTRCEIPPGPRCESNYCWNNGTCNDGTCQCRDPYFGPDCTNSRCVPECQNNASCYYGYCSCQFGYGGRSCENEILTCGFELCYHGTCNSTNCVCNEGYTGYGCYEMECNPGCLNGGNCYDGNCSCQEGYGGSRCETVVTPRCGRYLCYNGTCVNNSTCECFAGYQGRECYERSCTPECQNGGFCFDGNCTCPHPYSGLRCEIERTLCGNSTVCIYGDCEDDYCVCDEGFFGTNCDRTNSNITFPNTTTTTPTNLPTITPTNTTGPTTIPPIPCGHEFYCYNGATCNRNYSCICATGYNGSQCQEQTCMPACQNGGYCYDGVCHCSGGFAGSACEITPGPECDGHYCWNNGICNNGSCVCTSTYSGRYCQVELCPFDCLNNGSCYQGSCFCPYGFNGSRCEIPPGPRCGSNYCWNNGTCNDGTCQCRDPYYGSNCYERRCNLPCLNNGTCYSGYCSCPHGYSGSRCENEITRCGEYNLCYNGVCSTNGTCVCSPGYMGYGCSERTCDPQCLNGGYCYDGNCSCSYGFGGSRCERVVTPRCGTRLCYNGTCVGNTCVCFQGYQGPECFERACMPECQNGGFCFDGNCTCPHPYSGLRCEIERTLCGGSTICIYGQCAENRCICHEGFYGVNCDMSNSTLSPGGNTTIAPTHSTGTSASPTAFPTSTPPTSCGDEFYCYNGGSCDGTKTCICMAGYTGLQCLSAIASVSPPVTATPGGPMQCSEAFYCYNGGVCNGTNRCACQGGWSGPQCLQYSACPCLNGGICNANLGLCICPPRYTGALCEREVQVSCDVIVCQNGGSCVNALGQCQCPPGYTGWLCETSIDTQCLGHVQPIAVPSLGAAVLNFSWPTTQYGVVSSAKCPCSVDPTLTQGVFATRRCGIGGTWLNTDYSLCVTRTIQYLCYSNQQLNPAAITALLQSSESLTSGDVSLLTRALTSLMTSSNVNNEITRGMLLDSIDSILTVNPDILNRTSQTTNAATRIVESFETIGTVVELPSENRLSARRAAFTLTFADVSTADLSSDGYLLTFDGDNPHSALIPSSVFVNAKTRVSGSLIRTVGIFSGTDSTKVVASNVVSVTLNGRTVVGLQDKIIITIPKQRSTPSGVVDTCQFWDPTAHGGIGGWSTQGCEVISSTTSIVTCGCTHLSSFAVIQVAPYVPTTPTPTPSVSIIVIAVPAAVGGLLLMLAAICLLGCCCCLCKKSSKRQPTDGSFPVMASNPAANVYDEYPIIESGQGELGELLANEKEIEALGTQVTSDL